MQEQNSSEWQAPPPPEKIEAREPAQMSEAATLGNIFFEPGRTFEDLRRKPRFIFAMILIALLVAGYSLGLQYKVGESGLRTFIADAVEKRAPNLSAEQKASQIDMQMKINSFTKFAVPVFVIVAMFIGGLLYWGAAKAFGGDGGFLHAVSVFTYSSVPPTVVGMIASFIIMAFKSADDIDLGLSQRGLLNANLGFFVNGHQAPVLATLLATFDLLAIWGWILAAIGLRITNRLSKGSAWAIVIIIALIGVAFRVFSAFFSGNPA
jgi:hypothetical protein